MYVYFLCQENNFFIHSQAVVSVACLLSFFYIVVISWAIWYLVASFSLTLAWANCDNEFNNITCFSPMKNDECPTQNNSSFCHTKKYDELLEICNENQFLEYNPANGSCYNPSNLSNQMIIRTTSAEEYWDNYVLGHIGYSWENYVRLIQITCLMLSLN